MTGTPTLVKYSRVHRYTGAQLPLIGRSGRLLTVGPGHARTPLAAALHLVGDIGAVVVRGPGRSRNDRISSRVPPRARRCCWWCWPTARLPSLRTTQALAARRQPQPVAAQIAAGSTALDYATFLSWRGFLDREPPRRPDPDPDRGTACTAPNGLEVRARRGEMHSLRDAEPAARPGLPAVPRGGRDGP